MRSISNITKCFCRRDNSPTQAKRLLRNVAIEIMIYLFHCTGTKRRMTTLLNTNLYASHYVTLRSCCKSIRRDSAVARRNA
jgi:hypothetical protein